MAGEVRRGNWRQYSESQLVDACRHSLLHEAKASDHLGGIQWANNARTFRNALNNLGITIADDGTKGGLVADDYNLLMAKFFEWSAS